MTVVQEVFSTHPLGAPNADLIGCVEACYECAQSCTACADACLAEERHLAELVRCIRLNLDCADVCETTGRLLSRLTEAAPSVLRAQLEACAEACRVCAEECERHAEMGMEHCRVCAEACRRCEEACRSALGTVAA